jgi:hypothetical protein
MTPDIHKLYDDRAALYAQWYEQRQAVQHLMNNASQPWADPIETVNAKFISLSATRAAIAAQIMEIEVQLSAAARRMP